MYPKLGIFEEVPRATEQAKIDVAKALAILNKHLEVNTFMVGHQVLELAAAYRFWLQSSGPDGVAGALFFASKSAKKTIFFPPDDSSSTAIFALLCPGSEFRGQLGEVTLADITIACSLLDGFVHVMDKAYRHGPFVLLL